MKIGARKPSLKKSIKARTTGKAKRQLKKVVVPGYGQKGTGWIKDPKKAAYNKVYNKTSYDIKGSLKSTDNNNLIQDEMTSCLGCGCCGVILFVLIIVVFFVL